MKTTSTTRQISGKSGELMAARHLKSGGYTIIEQNKRVGRAEIDIIAQHAGILVFVEVKLRSHDAFGTPESFVTSAQVDRYHEAATTYMEEVGWAGPIRFDVVALEKKGNTTVLKHFKDAF